MRAAATWSGEFSVQGNPRCQDLTPGFWSAKTAAGAYQPVFVMTGLAPGNPVEATP